MNYKGALLGTLPPIHIETHAEAQEGSGHGVTLCSLPDDVIRKVMQPLTFTDKCNLQVLHKGFHALLSDPSPSEGVWGRCDLVSDLKLHDNFDNKDTIMR